MTNFKIPVAVIGQGEHSLNKLIPALKLSNKARIEYLIGRDLNKLKENSLLLDIPDYSNDWNSVLKNSKKPLSIVIASLPQLHYEVTKHCLINNFNIFIEKPPALNYEQMLELAKLQEKSKSIVMIGYNFSFSQYSKLLEICPNPRAGSLNFVVAKMTEKSDGFESVLDTVLYKVLIHPLHTIYHTFGEVTDFFVTYTSLENNKFSLDLLFNFKNNRTCHLHSGNYSNKFVCDFKLINQDCSVSMNSLNEIKGYKMGFKDDFKIFKNKQDFCFNNSPTISGYTNSGYQTEIDLWLDAIKNSNPKTPSTIKDSLYLYKLIEDIRKKIIEINSELQ